jgi:hypothetical protein
MKVEILYFDGCPTYETATKTLRAVLEEAGRRPRSSLSRSILDRPDARVRQPQRSAPGSLGRLSRHHRR